MLYIYLLNYRPENLWDYHEKIQTSNMLNKNIIWCRWDADTKELKINFDKELSADDKQILDNLVGS